MIRLRAFGGLELYSDEAHELATLPAQPKRFAVLFYLATAGPGFQRRDTLFGLFWPEADQSHARAALNQTLYVLRRELGHAAIASRGKDQVAVDKGLLWCDVVAFEAALDAGDRLRALELYRGELLPGFFLSDAPGWERWLELERERLRGRAAEAAWEAAEQAVARKQPTEAARWARRAADIAPLDELQLRRRLTLLARIGDRTGAARAFDEAATRFAADYEGELSAATRSLVERILAGDLEEVDIASAPPPTVKAGPEPPSHSPSDPPPRGRRRALRIAAGMLAGALIALAALSRMDAGAADVDTRSATDGGEMTEGVATAPDRLAVLPLSSAPGRGGVDVASALTDGLIRRLSKLAGLGVIGQASVAAYRDDRPPSNEIGSRLGARYLLEGTVEPRASAAEQAATEVSRAGPADVWTQVHVRLLDAATGRTLWAGRYETTLADLTGVEREVAVEVARALSMEVDAVQSERFPVGGTESAAARREYLTGRYLLGKSDEASFRAALRHFRRALDHDPVYADAWSGLSDAYDHLAGIGAMSSSAAYSRARAAAERALEIDPAHAEAHASLAMALSHHYWQSDEAERHWRRALELKPSDARARRTYASHLRNLGRFDEALAQASVARSLDPIPFFSHFELLVIPYFQRRHRHVIRRAESLAATDPIYGYAHFLRALALVQLERYDEASAALDEIDPEGEWGDARLIRAYSAARQGSQTEARRELRAYDEIENPASRGFERAILHLALDEPDLAVAALEEAYTARAFRLRTIGYEPLFDPLREDPRFQELLVRIGLGGIGGAG